MSLTDFQKLSKDKMIPYLKEMIPKNIYELKLIYYITLTDKPLELFSLWENSIKKSPEPTDEELKTKRIYALLTIFTFQCKLSYLERSFSILENSESKGEEIAFIKSIYYFYYTFENSETYIESKNFLVNFLLKYKMLANFFMNFSNLDKIQILITNNFDQFIDIFTDEFLITKIKSIRSEELKKEFIKKIIEKKPSFIVNQLKTFLIGSSNDFNSFLINEITENIKKFNNKDKSSIKTVLLQILRFNSSEIIHRSIYYYLSMAEPNFFIDQFKSFYKKEPYILKKDLVFYLLQIKDPAIYKIIFSSYINESTSWMKDNIYEQIDLHTKNKLDDNLALEFLKQFQQVQEDRFILIKSRFLFYLQDDDKVKQEIRLMALISIDKNFIKEVEGIFSKYLLMEKNFVNFKKAIQITINHGKTNVLTMFSILITKNPIDPVSYLKIADFYNFLCNVFLFGLNENTYPKIVLYYFPLLEAVHKKQYNFDTNKLSELFQKLDGLYSKIILEYLPFDNSTINARKNLFSVSIRFELENTLNLLMNLENDNGLLVEYVNIIEKYYIKPSVVKGLFSIVIKNYDLSDKIISILIKIIEENRTFDPFQTYLDENVSQQINFIKFADNFIKKIKDFKFVFSLNLIFLNPPEESQDILYDLFKFILVNNSEENNKDSIFPFLLTFEKNRKIIYKLFIDESIDKNKKVSIIELFADPQFSESASFLQSLLSEEDTQTSVKVINTIGQMNNPQIFHQLLDFVSSVYKQKMVQLQFAQSSLSSMSKELIPYLLILAQYDDAQVREAALVALGNLPASETLPVLIKDYIQNKNPEKLYNYYSKADIDLKKYWCDKLLEELKEERFLTFLMEGIYPNKKYFFDYIILEKILNLSEKSFYLPIVLTKIKSIPSSETVNSLILSPFLFISNESYYSIKHLSLLNKLKMYDLAKFAILSKNLKTIDYFFSISKNFDQIDYKNLFDMIEQFYGKDGLARLMPSILKFSKSIGVKNTVDFYEKVYDIPESYKIIISLYPLILDFDDCFRIIEKNVSLLPIVLKMSSKDNKTYQFFVNKLFQNSSEFTFDTFDYSLSFCDGFIPEDLKNTLVNFLKNENRENIINSGLFHIIFNLKNDFQLEQEVVELISSSLKIDNTDQFFKIIENSSNLILLDSILEKNAKFLNFSKFEILKRLIYSKTKNYKNNLLYTFFILDRKSFYQYLNSTNSKILDPYLLSIIFIKIDELESLSYNIIIKSALSLDGKNALLEKMNIGSIEEFIFLIYEKGFHNINYKDYLFTLNYLAARLEKNSDENIKIYFLKALSSSKISQFEKLDFINKFLVKTGIDEKSIFEMLSNIENSTELLYLLLFSEKCTDLSFATEYYIANIDIINISENILKIILPKLDYKAIGEFLISKNIDNKTIKKFVKFLPEIMLLKEEFSSLLSEEEIAEIYFNTANKNFLYFFLSNNIISIDNIFNQAKTLDDKYILVNDLLNYLKLFSISYINFKQMIQFIPKKQYKSINSKDFMQQYIFLVKLFINNYEKYDFIEKYNLFEILLNIYPQYLKLEKFELDFENEEKLDEFSCFVLLSHYIYQSEKVVTFINTFSLPIYSGFEKVLKFDTEEFEKILNELEKTKINEFDIFSFYEDVMDLLLKLFPDPEIVENYIVIKIKDNMKLSQIFWKLVLKYKIPNLLYLFDKYFGGIAWSKTREAYLKLFR